MDAPDHSLAANAIADRSSDQSAGSHRAQEDEEVNLRTAHGNVKAGHQVKRVVAGEAGQIEILGEDQRDQNGDRRSHAPGR